jgi:DNA-binding NarL/FixJ family response regulator
MVSVIIIDKVDILRRSMKRVLERAEDVSVLAEAADPGEGLNLCKFHKPDVVVFEADLASKMFWAALKQVREQCPETHVILLAGTQATEVRQVAVHMGIAAVVAKPIDADTLLATVSDVVNGRQTLSARANKGDDGPAWAAPSMVVVGSDADSRELLCQAAGLGGAEVVESTASLEAGAAACRAQSAHLLAVDLTQLGPTALDVMAALRAECPALKMVVVSAAADAQTVSRVHDMGVEAYLLKPVQPTVLAARLAQVLAAAPRSVPDAATASAAAAGN